MRYGSESGVRWWQMGSPFSSAKEWGAVARAFLLPGKDHCAMPYQDEQSGIRSAALFHA